MKASEVFNQQNGDVTKAYYARLNKMGYSGMLAVALFRAQKRSTAAKRYRNRFSRDAYEVKNWSLTQVVAILKVPSRVIPWGWRRDPKAVNFEWVLYVDLPTGQCSFHSAERLEGPEFHGAWKPNPSSETSILAFCDSVTAATAEREITDVH